MGNLTEASVWENNVYQIETTDPVLGGPTGIANQQAKQLASRTNFLRGRVGKFNDAFSITGNTSLTAAQVGKSVLLKTTANATVTLPPIAGVEEGQGFAIIAAGIGVCGIKGNASENIFLGGSKNVVYLYKGEHIYIIKLGSEWFTISASDSLTQVGDITLTFAQNLTVLANGSLLNRADYPRLWAFAQSVSGAVVTDAEWSGTLVGLFTSGNGTTTFRVPDYRGLFLRGLDLGKGYDPGRLLATVQADEIKSHTHGFQGNGVWVDNPGSFIVDAAGSHVNLTQSAATNATGGTETRPKNVALNPLIRY